MLGVYIIIMTAKIQFLIFLVALNNNFKAYT